MDYFSNARRDHANAVLVGFDLLDGVGLHALPYSMP